MTVLTALQEEDLTPGGEKGKVVKVKSLTQGSGWQKPNDSCSVEFKVSIAAADGTSLSSDTSVSSARIGFGELPEAYEAALQSMKQGAPLARAASFVLHRNHTPTRGSGAGQSSSGVSFRLRLYRSSQRACGPASAADC